MLNLGLKLMSLIMTLFAWRLNTEERNSTF